MREKNREKSSTLLTFCFGGIAVAAAYIVFGYTPIPPDSPVYTLSITTLSFYGLMLLPVAFVAGYAIRLLLRKHRSIDPVEIRFRSLVLGAVAWVLASAVVHLFLPPIESFAATFIIQAFAVAAIFAYEKDLDSEKLIRSRYFGHDIFLAILTAGLLFPILCVIYRLGLLWAPDALGGLAFTTTFVPRYQLVELALSILFIPFLEELLFRAGLIGWLKRYLPGTACILISAAAFAVLHGQPAMMWARGAAGIALGWLYLRRGNIVAPTALHALMNGSIALLPVVYDLFGGGEQ